MVLHVRLGVEEKRSVRALRRAGVNVSALVRKALRDAGALPRESRPKPAKVVLREVLRDYPVDAPRTKRPPLDNRLALAAFARKQIRRM
jgi:hypothetical protein